MNYQTGSADTTACRPETSPVPGVASLSGEWPYRMLVEEMPALICRFTPDGTLTFVNTYYCRYFKRSRTELIGTNIFDCIPEDQCETVRKHCAMLTLQNPSATYEHQAYRPDGTLGWQRWTDRALFDELGKLCEYQSIGEDITELKKAEEEKWHLEERLRNAQKMEAVAQLAGGIAHDFNNILGGIIGYSDVLTIKLPPSSELMEYAQKILRSAQKASVLVKQLLAFARKAPIARDPCDLHTLINRVVELLGHVETPAIRIQTVFTEQSVEVCGDADLLENMLYNVAINGFDAMPNGGSLTITTHIASTLPEGFGDQSRPDGTVGFLQTSITDTGVGIDDETLKHIFEPFFTTKSRDKGTGLGLPTAWGIIRQHKGCITVQSTVGSGTTFNIFLPITQATRQVQ